MAVTKRTRFEVLRRDEYTCRYCRSTTNELTIDHVVPVALGGTDDPSNLVAACRDCNSGKASSSPDASLVAQVDEDALRWARARARAVERFTEDRDTLNAQLAEFSRNWAVWDGNLHWLPGDWERSVTYWLRDGLTVSQIDDAMGIALNNNSLGSRDVFRYMAGVVRAWLRDIDASTKAELGKEES
jgi:hypothetical protein